MIAVARDYEGLRIAALELMQEAFDDVERERTLQRAGQGPANIDALLASLAPKRTVAEGYYTRVEYLFWLDSMLGRIPTSFATLSITEAEGLNMLTQARAEFKRQHPACPRCGAANLRFAFRCRECMADIGPRKK